MPTCLPEVLVIEPVVHEDARGFFLESWSAPAFAALGLTGGFVQDNHSRSARGVLRGIHYQLRRPQAKLVRVGRGRVFDVAVDLRRSSPRFGRWTGVELSDRNRHMLWIPAGFGHAFLTLEDDTDLLYKCSAPYAAGDDRALRWDDPAIGIVWPTAQGERPILSDRDAAAPLLEAAEVFG